MSIGTEYGTGMELSSLPNTNIHQNFEHSLMDGWLAGWLDDGLMSERGRSDGAASHWFLAVGSVSVPGPVQLWSYVIICNMHLYICIIRDNLLHVTKLGRIWTKKLKIRANIFIEI